MQNITLSIEIFWLTVTVAMTGLFWLPYIINRLYEEGVGRAIWNPNADPGPEALWAQRMMAAHENAVENLVIFVPLVLTVQILAINNDKTAMACVMYFSARFVHYLVFSFGVPVMRVATFSIGVVAQFILIFEILSYMQM